MTTAAHAARVKQLHERSVVFDTLGLPGPSVYTPEILARVEEMVAAGASPAEVVMELETLTLEAVMRDELPGFWDGWGQSGVDATSVTIGAFGAEPFSYDNAIRDIDLWDRVFERVPSFAKITRASDANAAKTEGKKGILLNFQNSTHFGEDLDNVRVFHERGVRVIQLTYNQRNLVGDGCTEPEPRGLTAFGKDLVRAMNEIGMLVDLSHCSEPTTLDAIEASARPVAITHASCKALSDHDRGKSDDVIRALGERGGYFGMLTVPFFLTDAVPATLDHFVAHVDHVVDLIGPSHVGIGTDWGQSLPKPVNDLLDEEMRRFGFRAEHRIDWAATLEGFADWREWPNITAALVAAGYSDEEITGFLGGNFLSVLEQATG